MNANRISPKQEQGFTLVELLVSTVVALFATLAILQSFAVSEGYRRTATGGGDASFGGALGAYLIDHDLRVAGFGINNATYYGCAVSGFDSSVTPANPINFFLVPASITYGGNAPDSVTFVASGAAMMPGTIGLTTTMATNVDDYQVSNAFGVNAGDVVLLAQAGSVCTIAQATNTPSSGASPTNTIHHKSGTYTLNGGTYHSRYNPSGGYGPAYSTSAVLLDLGASPIANTYYIQNGTLMVNQQITNPVPQVIATNVVQLKALYGKATSAADITAGIVDAWNVTPPLTAADWANVLAIRIALVARSTQPEKPDANGNCSTTLVAPVVTWDDGSTTTLDVSQTASTQTTSWMCYRYKVFHMTGSLRNLIWTPS